MEPTRESRTTALMEIRYALGQPLDPNDEFELAYSDFQINNWEKNAKEFGEEAYDGYMRLEEIYARCESPTLVNTVKIVTLRDAMQDYAEAHR